MARQPRTVSEIDTEIKALKRRRDEAVSARSMQIARLAAKAGLAELNVSDVELLQEFEIVAARFQRSGSDPSIEAN